MTLVLVEKENKRPKNVKHGPFPVTGSSVDLPALGFTPTDEQLHVLELFQAGHNLAVEAGAGAGKTSTLQLLARSTTRRGQYVAFNKAIVVEASTKMPSSVACSTAHSLAFRAVGRRYADRLSFSKRMRSAEVAKHLGIQPMMVQIGDRAKRIDGSYLGGLVLTAITNFCQSSDPEPTAHHVRYVAGIDEVHDGVREYDNNRIVREYLQPSLVKAWADLNDPDGVLPYKHDHYLKSWQLSDPKINADFILFDECQDANPVLLSIVERQVHAQRVYVGDTCQQIYAWNGAVNALDRIRECGGETAYLTKSFRFGPPIASVANSILSLLHTPLRLTGSDTVKTEVIKVDMPSAILTRTNAVAVRTVINLQRANRRVALVGNGDGVISFAKAAHDLMTTNYTAHPELACFRDWKEVCAYVSEDAQGSELRLLVKLVNDFGAMTIIKALNAAVDERNADIVVSTVHKAKGREWSSVQLAEDFPSTDNLCDEELRLMYVAATRAKNQLDLTRADSFMSLLE